VGGIDLSPIVALISIGSSIVLRTSIALFCDAAMDRDNV
jgi:hypothetical protein